MIIEGPPLPPPTPEYFFYFDVKFVITAGHVEMTGLLVQWEPRQIHGAAALQRGPDTTSSNIKQLGGLTPLP